MMPLPPLLTTKVHLYADDTILYCSADCSPAALKKSLNMSTLGYIICYTIYRLISKYHIDNLVN